MTMIIAFSWKDKILVMSDSRISKKRDGKVADLIDDQIKIYPIGGRFVIGYSGASKIAVKKKGVYINVTDVINYYINLNKENLNKVNGLSILKGLMDCWKNTLLKEKINPDDYDVNFLFCEWQLLMIPKIYCYSSKRNEIKEGSQVLGDREALSIIEPYIKTDIGEMKLEQVITHFMNGYSSVMKNVDTVGGDIRIYELNQNPHLSQWIRNSSST